MPWGGAGGQNIEHPYALAIFSSFFLFFKCILVLLARHSSGEIRYSATALIIMTSYVVMIQDKCLVIFVSNKVAARWSSCFFVILSCIS